MSESRESPLRVAVLVDSEYVQRWQRDALARLVGQTDARVTTVVINELETDADESRDTRTVVRDSIDRIRTYPLWSLLGVTRALTDDIASEQSVPITSVPGVRSADWRTSKPQSADEYWNTLPPDTVATLAETDIGIRFGFGMIKGEVLDAPTYGVLSYHLGDIREYRGQPGGFWEFLNGEDEMGITVQRLTDTLDGGEIAAIEHVDISQSHTFQAVRRQAQRKAKTMLVPAVETVTVPEENVTVPETIGTLYSMPEGRDVVRYTYKNTRGQLRNRLGEKVTDDRRISSVVTAGLLLVGVLLAGIRRMDRDDSGDSAALEQVLGLFVLCLGVGRWLETNDGP